MKKVLKALCVIICMITIFFFSNDNADSSTKKSDGVIIRISERVLGRKLTSKEKEFYTSKYITIVRKTAHFTIYFVLGLAFISLLKEYMIVDKKSIIYTVIFVFLYSCSDEIHQLFIPGRSGEILDVLIDTLGGTLSASMYYFIRRLKHE